MSDLDRFTRALRAVVREFFPDYAYRGLYEYQVAAVDGDKVDLKPVRSGSGLPALAKVPMFSGVPGARAAPEVNSNVVLGFLDGDPTRPYVLGYTRNASDDPWSVLTEADRVVRYGDMIAMPVGTAGTMTQIVVTGQATGVAVPATPPFFVSKVKA